VGRHAPETNRASERFLDDAPSDFRLEEMALALHKFLTTAAMAHGASGRRAVPPRPRIDNPHGCVPDV